MNELVQNYMAVRKRLLSPLNGRASSEIEVVSEPVIRQRRIERARAETEAARAAALEQQIEATKREIEERRKERDFLYVATDGGASVRVPTVNAIVSAVSFFYNIPVVDIYSQRRTANIVRPRQIAIYLIRTLTMHSLAETGRRMGGRDHTTILASIRKISRLIDEGDHHLVADIAELKKRLGAVDG